jgi:methionyl-tRNA formyltransferase
MRVLFMGTPNFACPSLEALAADGHEVVGVVTRPDKPAGRGRKVTQPPVKESALRLGLPVIQPSKVNAAATVDALRTLEPDMVVVAAFGAILRLPLLTLGLHGAVNVHASLLPAYRGVAPAQWSLIHGQRISGVTTMLMDEGVDTGPILERRLVEVNPMETAGELLLRLAELGGSLLTETLRGIDAGELAPVPQPEEGASYAPRLEKSHGYLDLSLTSVQVFNQFRGVTPAPGARVFLGEEVVLVESIRPVPGGTGAPYSVLEAQSRHLRVACAEGAIDLLQVRPPGKKSMDGASFARGRRLRTGDRLSEPPETPDLSLRIAVPS